MDNTNQAAEMGLRLRQPFLGRLFNLHIAASIATVVTAGLVAAVVTFFGPDTWLWPEATGGSLRHWIVGAGVVLLCLSIAGTTLEEMDRKVGLAVTGKLDGPEDTTKRAVLLVGFAALLTWPEWGRVAAAWQVNDVQAALPVATDVAVRLLPLALLIVIPAAARVCVYEYRTHLWHIQRRDHDQQDTPTPAADGPVPVR